MLDSSLFIDIISNDGGSLENYVEYFFLKKINFQLVLDLKYLKNILKHLCF